MTTKEYKSNIWSATATEFRNQAGKRNLIGRAEWRPLKQQMIHTDIISLVPITTATASLVVQSNNNLTVRQCKVNYPNCFDCFDVLNCSDTHILSNCPGLPEKMSDNSLGHILLSPSRALAVLV